MNEFVAQLLATLRVNYTALGFRLTRLRWLPWGENTLSFRFDLVCPCGARETAGLTIAVDRRYLLTNPDSLVHSAVDNALWNTASKEHLEDDVARGTLPPSAVDGAVYSGRLIIPIEIPPITIWQDGDIWYAEESAKCASLIASSVAPSGMWLDEESRLHLNLEKSSSL